MYNVSSNQNNNLWRSLIERNTLPNYFTEIINIDFVEFKAKMEAQNLDFQSSLINKMFRGAIIQITDVLDHSLINSIINSSLVILFISSTKGTCL